MRDHVRPAFRQDTEWQAVRPEKAGGFRDLWQEKRIRRNVPSPRAPTMRPSLPSGPLPCPKTPLWIRHAGPLPHRRPTKITCISRQSSTNPAPFHPPAAAALRAARPPRAKFSPDRPMQYRHAIPAPRAGLPGDCAVTVPRLDGLHSRTPSRALPPQVAQSPCHHRWRKCPP